MFATPCASRGSDDLRGTVSEALFIEGRHPPNPPVVGGMYPTGAGGGPIVPSKGSGNPPSPSSEAGVFVLVVVLGEASRIIS